jgi:glutamate--cysteine ligase
MDKNLELQISDFKECTRTGPFWSAFRERGYTLSESASTEAGVLVRLTSPNGSSWLTATNVSHPMVSGIVERISQNKILSYDFAKNIGIEVPDTEIAYKGQPIGKSQLLSKYKLVVVKPLDSFGSRGLTVNVDSKQQLDRSLKKSYQYSETALVQQQVEGSEFRFTIIDGKVVSILLRQPPNVVGDGHSSVAELIKKENIARSHLKFPHVVYPPLTETIIDAKYINDHKTVPQKDETVEFSRATMIKDGASVYEMIDKAHESYKDIAEKLAAELGANFIVVDIFIKSIELPAKKDMYWFNEFNTSPAIRMYYGVRNMNASHIADMIIDKTDKAIRSMRE